MDLLLILPMAVMLRRGLEHSSHMLPAFVAAGYMLYRFCMSVFHYRKSRKNRSILVAELRTVSLIDTLVAVLGLQSVLLNAAENSKEMRILTGLITGLIVTMILSMTVRSFLRGRRRWVGRDGAT